MDVSFLASGAINRTHFALAQKVESSTDPGIADEAIVQEIDAIRGRLEKPGFGSTASACRDWLLVLLYCETALTFGLPRPDYLHFAIRHAVHLAEGGKTLQERHVGYVFCAMIMPKNHELHLMLVNTCRKDLESSDTARICLALDLLIQSPTPDVIPAVSNRLEDLLSHDSPHVRRRVLTAFRILANHDPDLLKRTTKKIRKRMKDDGASGAAFLLALDLVRKGHLPNKSALSSVIEVLRRYQSTSSKKATMEVIRALSTMGNLLTQDQSPDEFTEILEIVRNLLRRSIDKKAPSHVLTLECFRALSYFPLEFLQTQFALPSTAHPISHIRGFLLSKDPNLQYLFIACISMLDVSLWAGTDERIAAQLRESEVGQVMSFLESNDPTIRTMTTQLLLKVDPAILEAYLSQYISTIPSPSHHSLAVCENYAARALEVAGLIDDEGATYANRVTEILNVIQRSMINKGKESVSSRGGSEKDPVHEEAAKLAGWGAGIRAILEGAVEMVLTRLRDAPSTFQTSFVTALCHNVILQEESKAAPTVTLIAAATMCEYGDHLVAPYDKVLISFSNILQTASPALREAILISMLRMTARVEEVPEEATTAVKAISKGAGRHIRLRINQFLVLTADLQKWKEALSIAKSYSLPEVLPIVEAQYALRPKLPSDTLSPRSQSRSDITSSPASRPLRYDAYQVPPIPTSDRERRLSGSHSTSIRFDPGRASPSPDRRGRLSQKSRIERKELSIDDMMAQTIVPGALGGEPGMQTISPSNEITISDPSVAPVPAAAVAPKIPTPIESLSNRLDLISLESPFHAEPPIPLDELGGTHSADVSQELSFHDKFAASWSALSKTSRGWCESSPEKVARVLHGMGIGFVTDFSEESNDGILAMASVSSDLAQVAMKLRLGDEGSCLWIMKCDDVGIAQKVKSALVVDLDN